MNKNIKRPEGFRDSNKVLINMFSLNFPKEHVVCCIIKTGLIVLHGLITLVVAHIIHP